MTDLDEYNKKQIFIRDGMPGEWLQIADEFYEAAETLWESRHQAMRVEATAISRDATEIRKLSGVSRPYILLAGFALENLLKGLIVADDPSQITSGKLGRHLKTHNLLGLVGRLDSVNLDEDERRLCQMTHDAIPYWGRYPIPTKTEGVLPEIGITDGLRQAFIRLHFRLGKRIYEQIKGGWDSGAGPKHMPGVFILRYE